MIAQSELRQLSYAEFGELLDDLTEKVKAGNVRFDLVVPILRSGGFTGLHLASKLKVSNILPVQYKYVYEPKIHVIKKFEPGVLNFKVPAKAKILVVDSNTAEGNIAHLVIRDVAAVYPAASIYFASAAMDVTCQLKGVQAVFVGCYTNEARHLDPSQAAKQGISQDVIIFPWENLDEQWEEIELLQKEQH